MPNIGFGCHCVANDLYNEGFQVIFPIKLKKIAPLFPISRNVLNLKTNFIHMHWIEGYAGFSTKNRIGALIKSLTFIIDVYILKYLLRAKLVWTIHNLYSHECAYPKMEKVIKNFFSKKVDAIICQCKYAKKKFIKEFGAPENKIHIISHGFFKCFENQISKEKARNHLNLRSDDLVFLFFGSIRPYKGILHLIKSFKKLSRDKNVKLLIVGKPKNNQIKKDILNRIKNSPNIQPMLNFIAQDQIQIYINASDLIIFSYKKILTPGGIFLAMSFGKPVIAPRLGCIPELVNEKGAFLYNPKKPDGLLNALEEAIQNKDKLTKMGENNFITADDLEWKRNALETKKIYEGLF